MPVNLKEYDRRIIDILREDSRKKKKEIAKELGISRQTVHNRINALEKKGLIKFSIKENERLLGKEVKAITLVTLHKVKAWSVSTAEIWARKEDSSDDKRRRG